MSELQCAAWVLAVVHLASGITLLAMSVLILRNKLGRNALVGFRFEKAFESDELWQKINRFGARKMIPWSILLMITGPTMACPLVHGRPALLVAVAILPALFLIIPCLQTYRFTKSLD